MKHFFTLICAYIGSALTCLSSQPATQGAPAIYVGMVNEGDTAYVARNIQDAVEHRREKKDFRQLKEIRGINLPEPPSMYTNVLVTHNVIDEPPALFLAPGHQYILCFSPATYLGWVIKRAEEKAYLLPPYDSPYGTRPAIMDDDTTDAKFHTEMGNSGSNGIISVYFLKDGFIISQMLLPRLLFTPEATLTMAFECDGVYIHKKNGGVTKLPLKWLSSYVDDFTINFNTQSDNYYVTDLIGYESNKPKWWEDKEHEGCLFVQTDQGLKRKGDHQEFFLLDKEWYSYYHQNTDDSRHSFNIEQLYKRMNYWFCEKQLFTKCKYAVHYPETDKKGELFFFHWVSRVAGTDYNRIQYLYTDRTGGIVKQGHFYPAEYDDTSGDYLITTLEYYNDHLHCADDRDVRAAYINTPQKIGTNSTAILVHRSKGKYIYYIVSPHTERIIQIHANTALYFLPTLLDNGKTVFAVSRDEVMGYNAPYPCITPNDELLYWEVKHCIRSGAYAYFIELPMNIE